MQIQREHSRVYRVGHLACGIGSGAAGFNDARPSIGNVSARFECAGGIDIDPGAIENFERLTGVKGTVMDLFDLEQYVAFHGTMPPPGWREATPADVRAALGGSLPLDVLFSSPPCKGLSSLLSKKHVGSTKYEALNRLTVRTFWLALEAYKNDPIKILLLENVPGLMTKGQKLVNEIKALLRAYGYVYSDAVHDVGETGGLAQHRKRYLLVARHVEKVPPFLYQPKTRPMRSIGDVLKDLPLPGDPRGGPMHRIPNLHWQTWVRLAFVEAGSDWKSMEGLRAGPDGNLLDWGIAPDGGLTMPISTPIPPNSPHNQVLGVRQWNGATGTVTGASRPQNGTFAVADPRYGKRDRNSTLGVVDWDGTSGTIPGRSTPTNGAYALADPRYKGRDRSSTLGVRRWSGESGAITGETYPSNGSYALADPRTGYRDGLPCYRIVPLAGGEPIADPKPSAKRLLRGKYRLNGMDDASGTVIGASTTGEGAFAIADDRYVPSVPGKGDLPKAREGVAVRIIARDGTWHRPYTALDLAALQALLDPKVLFDQERPFDLGDHSDETKREWIGNAVPRASARSMAETIGETLIMADLGITFTLSQEEIWAKPLALALSVDLAAPGGEYAVQMQV